MSRPVTGTVHHVPFYATPGLELSSFTVNISVTNGTLTQPASSAVLNSLSLVYIGNGFYQFEYTPDVIGYYLMTASAGTVNVVGGVDIDASDSYVLLTQTTPPGLVPNVVGPQNYILMVFLSSDWQVGRYNPLYAVASTQLDSQGNWLSTPLTVQHGIYHVVVQANDGTQVVIAAFLEV